MNKILLSLLSLCMAGYLFIGTSAQAVNGSGACSGHDGVNCLAGSDWDGSAICSDGWRDSTVQYSVILECKSTCVKVSPETYTRLIEDSKCTGDSTQLLNQRNALINARFNGKYNPTPEELAALTQEQKNAIQNKDNNLLNTLLADVNTKRSTLEDCLTASLKLITQFCPDTSIQPLTCSSYGTAVYLGADSLCYCNQGYEWNSARTKCVLPAPTPIIDSTPNTIATSTHAGAYNPLKKDSALTKKLTGSILLQVETYGEAWYLDPVTLKRYYMKDGATAYEMMRSFGLGVSESDYEKINAGNSSLLNHLRGKIILRAQAHGEAYYIHPKDLAVYYLQNGDEAYRVMRLYSLGITNADLEKIPTGELLK